VKAVWALTYFLEKECLEGRIQDEFRPVLIEMVSTLNRGVSGRCKWV